MPEPKNVEVTEPRREPILQPVNESVQPPHKKKKCKKSRKNKNKRKSMMANITLNVNVKTPTMAPSKSQQKQKATLSAVKKRGTKMQDFDFNFNVEKPKVKATAVRRKAPSTTTPLNLKTNNIVVKTEPTLPKLEKPSKPSDELKSNGIPSKGQGKSASLPLPKLGKPSKPSNGIPTKGQGKPSTANDDIMLNVTTSAPSKNVSKIKPKIKSRAERMGKIRKPATKLSEEQLKLLKTKARGRVKNPNQMPRPGDIFRAQMEEERRNKAMLEAGLVDPAGSDEESSSEGEEFGKGATSESESESEEPPTKPQPKVPNTKEEAAAQNRFRTKKVGLFDQSDVEALKQLGQRVVKPVTETIFSGLKVETLGLHPHAVKNLQDLLGIRELTTVQQRAIPHVLAGKDVLVRSQTGSGKTLAYALPMVELLQMKSPKVNRKDGVLALVIVPTRELVIQTYELVQKLVKPYTWIVPGSLLGGESRKSEKARLRKGLNILIGTPGRLVDHLLHTASFKLTKLQFLILDEADRLLELGYERDVKQLVEAIDKQRAEEKDVPQLQRMLLSATLTSQVQQLAGLTLRDPLYIDNSDVAASAALKARDGYQKDSIEAQLGVDDNDGLGEYQEDLTGVLTIPEHLQLSYVVVPPKLRLVALSALLAKELDANPKHFKALVFMSTTEMVNFHHDMLNEALTQRVLDDEDEEDNDSDEDDPPLLKGLRFFKLHGSMTQTERQGVFRGFQSCDSCVLLATDVVGRGIDVPDIKLVVQYTPPQTTADFVHRVGRTARAGRKGRAVLFLAPSEAQYIRHLEKKRIRIQQGDMYVYLQTLLPKDDEARSVQEAASNLQHKFQSLLEDDKELHDKSCKAFVSWMKFYSTFPKELKPIFNVKVAHMGHFAKSFALKEAPSKFAAKHTEPKAAPPTNRLTYTERDPEKMQAQKRTKRRIFTTTVGGEGRQLQQKPEEGDRRKGSAPGGGFQGGGVSRSSFMKSLAKNRALNCSEFDSGLSPVGPAKRRKME